MIRYKNIIPERDRGSRFVLNIPSTLLVWHQLGKSETDRELGPGEEQINAPRDDKVVGSLDRGNKLTSSPFNSSKSMFVKDLKTELTLYFLEQLNRQTLQERDFHSRTVLFVSAPSKENGMI